MAAAVLTAQVGKRRHRRRPVMSEINVTPMVDVMLVLLIIFMVSAPLLTVGVPIDLPQTQAKSLDQDKEPLTVSVKLDGEVFLQNTEIKVDELVPKLQAITQARGGLDERIYVRGDRKVDYGTVMRVMGRLPARRAGDRGRAGEHAGRAMRKGLAISAVVHAMVLLWSLITFGPKAFQTPTDSVPVDIISATDFSRMVAGSRTAPKAPVPKPVVDKVGETKLTDNSAPKIVDKPEVVKTAEKEAPPPEAKPEPQRETERKQPP